jgi:hypothetical protein
MMPKPTTSSLENETPRVCGVFVTAFGRTKWEGVFDATNRLSSANRTLNPL